MKYYPNCCTRGEIIALLYNHAIQVDNSRHITSEITPEEAEELVHKKFGNAHDLTGMAPHVENVYIDEINGVCLNVRCEKGAIDVSGYMYDDGNTLIDSFISKRLSNMAKYNAQSVQWEDFEG